jgi:Na+/H+ antiporter NhaD/arsenite permease-like protein
MSDGRRGHLQVVEPEEQIENPGLFGTGPVPRAVIAQLLTMALCIAGGVAAFFVPLNHEMLQEWPGRTVLLMLGVCPLLFAITAEICKRLPAQPGGAGAPRTASWKRLVLALFVGAALAPVLLIVGSCTAFLAMH